MSLLWKSYVDIGFFPVFFTLTLFNLTYFSFQLCEWYIPNSLNLKEFWRSKLRSPSVWLHYISETSCRTCWYCWRLVSKPHHPVPIYLVPGLQASLLFLTLLTCVLVGKIQILILVYHIFTRLNHLPSTQKNYLNINNSQEIHIFFSPRQINNLNPSPTNCALLCGRLFFHGSVDDTMTALFYNELLAIF